MNTDHGHNHGPADYNRAFVVGILLNLAFVGAEVGFGLLSNSLALIADAGHNLSDVFGLVVAWVATLLARRRPTQRHTYGLGGSSILAALANAVLLLVAIGAIAWEALRRFGEPAPVAGWTVIWVAAIGIVVNGATALLFMAGRQHDLNIRGAFLHMAADAGVSLGVVLAGIAILATGWAWLDPAISLLIALVIFVSTWGLLREAVNMALNAVPEGIDTIAVERRLAQLPGVLDVHDLHIWPISTTDTVMTAHAVIAPGGASGDALLQQAREQMRSAFGIDHLTLQLEGDDPAHPCERCSFVRQAAAAEDPEDQAAHALAAETSGEHDAHRH